jgi:hypothetical protein
LADRELRAWTYNWRMSASWRPGFCAAAPACRFTRSLHILVERQEIFGWVGRALATARSAERITEVFMLEGGFVYRLLGNRERVWVCMLKASKEWQIRLAVL